MTYLFGSIYCFALVTALIHTIKYMYGKYIL